MLTFKMDGKSVINPNEEIRNQFKEIMSRYELGTEELYDAIYDTIESLREINYFQYCMVIQFIYKEVYTYFQYMNKSCETNQLLKDSICLLSASNPKQVMDVYLENVDLLIENFAYLLSLNNMFRVKLLLELSEKQNKFLNDIYPFHLYDQLALQEYIGFHMFEDYYLNGMSDELEDDDEEEHYEPIPEELVADIIHFLDYLYFNHRDIYQRCIKEIVEKIYKWCCYYLENSTEIEESDLEVRVINLINGSSIDEISEKVKNNPNLLTEILLRIFDDMDMGYPIITTNKGDKLITEPELDEYIIKIKRKQF